MGYAAPAEGGHALPLDPLPDAALPVTGVAVHYPAGHVVPRHQHPYGHIIYAREGLLRVEADSGQWLVPPTAAVWLRPHVGHQLTVPVALQAHGLFVRPDLCARLPAADGVVGVGPLLRELILALTALPQPAPAPRARLLGELIVDEMQAPAALPFHLPWPADAQMARVCAALQRDPGRDTSADEWARTLALGSKTFQRRFLAATGLSFGRWRQQLRLLASIPWLMQGVPITRVALDSGYDSHSAYTLAFRRQFGQPPSAYAKAAAA